MSSDPKDDPRNPIDDFLDSIEDDAGSDPLDNDGMAMPATDAEPTGEAQVPEPGDQEGQEDDVAPGSTDDQALESGDADVGGFNADPIAEDFRPRVDHQEDTIDSARPAAPGDHVRSAAASARTAFNKAAGLVAGGSAVLSGLVSSVRQGRRHDHQEFASAEKPYSADQVASPNRSTPAGSEKTKRLKRNGAFVVAAVLILAVAGINRCSAPAPMPPSEQSPTGLDITPLPQESAEEASIELPPLEPQRDDSLDLLPEVEADSALGDPHQYQSISFGPLGASASPALPSQPGSVASSGEAALDQPEQPAASPSTTDPVPEEKAEAEAEAAPATSSKPSPTPAAGTQAKAPATPRTVSPPPKASPPRRTASEKPDIRIGAIVSAAGCWNCAPSVLVLHKAGRDIVAAGDQWKGYTVSVFGDRVTLTSKTGSWSFLPER